MPNRNSIQNLWCVGRNYAEHAKELQNEIPTSPLIFLKSGACLDTSSKVALPPWAEEIHHEIELVLQVNEKLQYESFGLGLDLTERKLQGQLKAKGQPWTLAKSFINAAPISGLIPLRDLSPTPFENWWGNLELSLTINEQLRQQSVTAKMIFDPFALLDFIKMHFPLQPNDLIFTGTPAGVAALRPKDHARSQLKLNDRICLDWSVYF